MEEAVAEVFNAATPKFRAEIVRRVAAELESLIPSPGSSPTDILSGAVTSIQEASSQADILRQLLEGGARFAGRVGLFVVKGSTISGWQGTGFDDNDFIKTITLNGNGGLAAAAVRGREPAAGSTAEFDPGFIAGVGPPADHSCLILPLVVKDKVAAVVYADAGRVPGGVIDASALGVLARWAGLWLELSALRKLGSSLSQDQQPAAPATATAGAAPATGSEDELHRKARRFAKLLVEEIKLYNQSRVVEGKLNRDLYERLKEDIEKSRATYDKRYRETPVASADYFNQELIRILADNDISLLGGSFQR